MGIGNDRAVPREMFCNGGHPGAAQTAREFGCKLRNDLRFGVKGPVTDDAADAPVEIHTGRKAQIDTTRPEFGGNQPAGLPGKRQRAIRVRAVLAADDAHRRNWRESVPEALHPPPFVVHGNDRCRAPESPHLVYQVGKLLWRLVIATEENESPDRRLPQ